MKALFVLTNTARLGDTEDATGFHLSEVTHPLAELEANGVEVDFASPNGGRSPITAADRSDPLNASFLDDPERMRQVESTLGPAEVSAGEYELIMFAGGHGTMWDFPEATGIAEVASTIYERGGVVGAVCHGPAGLLPVRLADGRPLVQGKRVAAFTNAEEVEVQREEVIPFYLADALIELGATHVPQENWAANVVVDERLVTGQNPASAAGVGREMARLVLAAQRA